MGWQKALASPALFMLWCLSSDLRPLLGTAWEQPGAVVIFHSASAPGCCGNLACASTHVYEGIYQGIAMGSVARVNLQDSRQLLEGSLEHL